MPPRRARRRRPTPADLAAAPDLAILAALQTTLDLAIAALLAAQPDLRSLAGRRGHFASTQALRAAHVITHARGLTAAPTCLRRVSLVD